MKVGDLVQKIASGRIFMIIQKRGKYEYKLYSLISGEITDHYEDLYYYSKVS